MNSNNILSETLNFPVYSAALHNSPSLSLFAHPCSRRTSCHGASLTTYQLWHYILRSLPLWMCSGTNPKEWFWWFIVNVVFLGFFAASFFRDARSLWPQHSHRQRPVSVSQQPHPPGYESHLKSIVLLLLECIFSPQNTDIPVHQITLNSFNAVVFVVVVFLTPLCCFGSSLSNIKGLLVWKRLKILSFRWVFDFSDISDVYIRIQLLVCVGAQITADFCKAADVALSQKRHAFMALVKWFITPDATWF